MKTLLVVLSLVASHLMAGEVASSDEDFSNVPAVERDFFSQTETEAEVKAACEAWLKDRQHKLAQQNLKLLSAKCTRNAFLAPPQIRYTARIYFL